MSQNIANTQLEFAQRMLESYQMRGWECDLVGYVQYEYSQSGRVAGSFNDFLMAFEMP